MKVAIIGVGRMGQWFARYFTSRGDDVIVSDIDVKRAKALAKEQRVAFSASNLEATQDAELVLISVSIEATPSVISEISPYVAKGIIVAEISSVKAGVMKALRELLSHNVRPLSLHPLFGPGAKMLKGRKMAVVRIHDSKKELNLAKRLFPEAELHLIGAEEHDRLMALTLSLPHFVNLAFASALSEESISALKKFGGPSFTLQLNLAESILLDNPQLFTSIQTMNEHTVQYLDKFLRNAMTLKKAIEDGRQKEIVALFQRIKKALDKSIEEDQPYEKLYALLEDE